MELLRQHGLQGEGLLTVDNPVLVGRYNDCLIALGLKPTALRQFQIDGQGWSPEIAEEQGNPTYLSHGGAVQFAVILTPDQKGKPVYQPFYSFERAILADLFRRGEGAIARITQSSGISVQMDPGLSELTKLADLLMVRSVTVSLADTAGLIQAADGQRQLVYRFCNEAEAWTDADLRKALVESGHQFGDLRFAPSFKISSQFTEVECYYTQAFSGVFVLRAHPGQQELVVSSKKILTTVSRSGCRVFDYSDRGLFARLADLGLIEIPLDWYKNNLGVLQMLRETMLVAAIYRHDDEIDFMKLTEAQRKRYIIDHRKQLPAEFSALERLEQKIVHDDPIDPYRLPTKMRWLLARPHRSLSLATAEVVWKLICRVSPSLVTNWYAYDKETFFARYAEWSNGRRTWTVRTLLTSGLMPRRHT